MGIAAALEPALCRLLAARRLTTVQLRWAASGSSRAYVNSMERDVADFNSEMEELFGTHPHASPSSSNFDVGPSRLPSSSPSLAESLMFAGSKSQIDVPQSRPVPTPAYPSPSQPAQVAGERAELRSLQSEISKLDGGAQQDVINRIHERLARLEERMARVEEKQALRA
uniref:Uncharacterized protein n=1 Tax=Palpitomonas bilix TaxID=652834 RepID=A0A7S3DK32_9EUKA|mmetsp:Transcript_41168/g.106398  ORF Transcript_41168/g.106398 Transcript_41168/m.106398 type:complete len:169 (+) Transcript_41168:156-662(+)|eukprot:CAMPEP_0113880738 /NCGR_PEP_ID=MMETSP0780_2-20120614/7959_1 /TAXON_ID=652834 /ORGANISM="Palpitomonas bilix" /LENGTH=168 /DNA_ID=CAMNT_0000867461 /DNA_START=106 /DNA_END=612 /DNA_ORIENTATION=- /assembly_acc=CAM_ASM_000599